MRSFGKSIQNLFGIEIARSQYGVSGARRIYKKYQAYTMINEERFIANLSLVRKCRNINGCVVECGTWRGGMSAGIAEILQDRDFHLFDSFEGLPQANEIDGKAALDWQNNPSGEMYNNNCTAEVEVAEEAMAKTHVKYHIVKGWFKDTLRDYEFNNDIALLRLDADWYESTMDCLVHLFPKVAKNGLIVFDDYYTWDGCSRAVHDYLSQTKSSSRLYMHDHRIAYIVKND